MLFKKYYLKGDLKMTIISVLIKIGIVLGIIAALLGITLLVLFLLASEMPDPQKKIGTAEELDNYLNLITENNTPPAISVAVYKNGISVYNKAFGYLDPDRTVKANPDTGYAWWSATNLFTATAVLQLYKKGLLNLDDNVNKYLDYFNPADKNGNTYNITIRHQNVV